MFLAPTLLLASVTPFRPFTLRDGEVPGQLLKSVSVTKGAVYAEGLAGRVCMLIVAGIFASSAA